MLHRRWFLCLAAAAALAALLPAGCARPEQPGHVYYLNFKPEQDAAWQDLAALYTRQTGVAVQVVTPASGDYDTVLGDELAKSSAPTLFQVNGPVGLNTWQGYCYDLTDAPVTAELTNDAYTLQKDGAVLGIGYVVESYGIIVNQPLLARAGYTAAQIDSFAALQQVAEDITARRDELGFAAFTCPAMDSSSDWRYKTHLANLPLYFEYLDRGIDRADHVEGTYLDNFRAIFDLYLQNATCAPTALAGLTGEDSRAEFLTGQAVFYQNGSWEYAALTADGAFADDELTMLPIYIGVGDEANQGLCTGTENYWCVNREATQADIDATLDFLYWCVTSPEGTRALAEDMGFVIPFKGAQEPVNLFARIDSELTAAGREPVSWCFSTMPSTKWKNGVGAALSAYAAGTGSWQEVVTAFVDGWAAEMQGGAA